MQQIKKEIGVNIIESLDDISKVNEFVFNIVPVPLYEKHRTRLKAIPTHKLPVYFDLWKNLKPDKNGYYGNWCGFHARLLVKLLSDVYNFKNCNIWGYGLKRIVNHVAVMVVWNNKRYHFDPYFGLHYKSLSGDYLTFDQLRNLLKSKKFQAIKKVFPNDSILKNVMQKSKDGFTWVQMNPNEFHNHIHALFRQHNSEGQLMNIFGNTEHMQLILLS